MMNSAQMRASITVYLSLTLSVFIFMIFTFLRIGIIGSEKQRFELASNLALNSALGEYSKALYDRFDLLYIDASYLGLTPNIGNVSDRINYYMTENAQNVYQKKNAPWGRIKVDNTTINGFECATSGDLRNMTSQAVMYVEDSPHTLPLVTEVNEALCESVNISRLDSDDPLGKFREYKDIVDGMPLPVKTGKNGKEEEVPVSNPADWVYGLSGCDVAFLTETGNGSFSFGGTDLSNLISHRGALFKTGIKGKYRFDDALYGAYEIDKFGCYLNEKPDTVLALELEYIVAGHDNDYDNFKEVLERLFRWRLSDNLELAFGDGGIVAESYSVAAELEVSILNPAFIEPVANTIIAACAYLETISDMRCLLRGGKVPVRKSSHNMSVSNVLSGNVYCVESDQGLSYRQYLECMIFLETLEERLLKNMDLMEMEVRNKTGNSSFCMDYCIEEIDVTLVGNGSGFKTYELNRRYGYF